MESSAATLLSSVGTKSTYMYLRAQTNATQTRFALGSRLERHLVSHLFSYRTSVSTASYIICPTRTPFCFTRENFDLRDWVYNILGVV